MKKMIGIILLTTCLVRATEDQRTPQYLSAPLTIQETFSALKRIMDNLTCLALAPEHAPAMNHASTLMHSCMGVAQEIMQAHALPQTAPLNELIQHIAENKSPAELIFKNRNPIDDLEASQNPNKPARRDDDDRLTETALTSFLNCCGHFAAITSNPKNPNVVRPHVLGMVGNILNVAREACRGCSVYELQPQQLEVKFTDIVLEQVYAIRVARLQGAN